MAFLNGPLSATAYVLDPPDTIPLTLRGLDLEDDSISQEEDFEQLEDVSECLIRNCDLYSVWDTARINPYGVDMRQKKDTTLLTLMSSDNLCDYFHPVCGAVTSDFGFRKYRFHYGIDIDLETGDPVFSAFEGTVRIARYSTSYGYYVIVRHLNGLETLYAHLSSLSVNSGQYLQAGDVLGLGGNTGHSRGSHLHFEVRFLGQQLNPRDLISFEEYACLNPEIAIHAKRFDYLKEAEKHKAAMAARKYYKVRKGDTLSKIAKKHHTTIAKICKMNKLSKRSVLKPGKRLLIG